MGERTSSISALLALVAWLVIAGLIYWVVTRIITLTPLPVARSARPCPPFGNETHYFFLPLIFLDSAAHLDCTRAVGGTHTFFYVSIPHVVSACPQCRAIARENIMPKRVPPKAPPKYNKTVRRDHAE